MAATSPWSQLHFGIDQCRGLLGSVGLKVWKAVLGNEIVGFIALRPEGVEGEPLLEYVCVSSDHRGQGHGTRLIAFVEAKCQRYDNIYLFVSDFNTHAIQLYERLGYQRVGTLRDYNVYGQTEYLYRKTSRPRQQEAFGRKHPGRFTLRQGKDVSYDLNSGYARMAMPDDMRKLVVDRTVACLSDLDRDKVKNIEKHLHEEFLRFISSDQSAERHLQRTFSTFSGSIALDRIFGAVRRLAGDCDSIQSPLTVVLPEPSLDLWQQLLKERSADFDDIQIIGVRDFENSEQRTDKLIAQLLDERLRPATTAAGTPDEWRRGRQTVVVVDSPSNPQGFLMSRDELRRLAAACKKAKAILVVDHCFLVAGLHYSSDRAKRAATAYELKPEQCDWYAVWDTGKSIDLAGDKVAFITASDARLAERLGRSLCVIQPSTYTAQRSLEILRELFEERTVLESYLSKARDLCNANLKELLKQLPPEWKVRTPAAGSFACVTTDCMTSSEEFAKFWESAGVGVACGQDFMASMFDEGSPIFVRLSLFKPLGVFSAAVQHAVSQWPRFLEQRRQRLSR